MAVRYKYKPSDFELILKDEFGFVDTLGKFEYESVVKGIIEDSIKNGEWVQKELEDVHTAEKMADNGLLFRISPPVKHPRYDELGWLCYGKYEITNEALEIILTRFQNKYEINPLRKIKG